MRKIKYPLIISDFDGTLVNGDGSILQSTKDIIAQYRLDGGKFAVSTGRMPKGILSRAQELGLQGAVSCCQGSVIMDIQSEEVLYQDRIPNKIAIEICKKMEALDLHIHVYDLWDFYCNKDDDALKLYEHLVRSKAKLVLDKPLSKFLEETGMGVYKFLAMVKAEDNARIFSELAEENFKGCCITKSGDFLVEVINARNSKGTALAFLGDYYGVPIEKTIAIGDQWNDIPMIEKAGLGIAVKNADDKLKEQADVVSEYTNEEGAVGKVIQKYCYEE